MHAPRPHGSQRSGDVGRPALALLFVAAMAVVALPVITHPLPPLTDYLNNLAGTHVVTAIRTDADLQRFYFIEWFAIPNLMMDLVVPLMSRLVGIYAAGQIFIIAALALILSGAFALNRALFGRWSALPFVAAILLYNEVLLVGVLNYIAGIGIALWALAAWVALRERAWPWRMAVSTVFVLLLFACHLFALGIYGLGLLAFESARLWAKRTEPLGPRLADFVATGAPFIPAALLLLRSATWGLASGWYWVLGGKLDGLLMPFTIYVRPIAYLVVAAAIAAIALAARAGALRFHRFGWFLLAIAVVVYLVMPRAVFSSHLADQRLPAALVFVLIACVDLDFARARVRTAFAAFVVVLLALRIGEVQWGWDKLGRELAPMHASVSAIARGSRVLVVQGDRDAYNDETGTLSDFGLMHAASLATIERSALVTTNFTVLGKHILHVRPKFRDFVETNDNLPPLAIWLRDAADPPAGARFWFYNGWPRKYDYVYLILARPADPNPDERYLRLVDEGPGFRLYRVANPG